MTNEWLDREALITVKAYPNPSAKYHESVCVAAITREEGWIRLYPVQFRELQERQSFKKYQRIRLRMQKHQNDDRPESFRPDESSIKLLEVIGTEHKWAKRWEWIKPTLSTSMCQIQLNQKKNNTSLGVFRPKKVNDLIFEDSSSEWTGKKQAALDQLMLFEKQTTRLEKIPFTFKFKYICEDKACKGHQQSILDWELMELYRKIRDKTDSLNEIKKKIREKYLDELCGPQKDTLFFVGNHSDPQKRKELYDSWCFLASY